MKEIILLLAGAVLLSSCTTGYPDIPPPENQRVINENEEEEEQEEEEYRETSIGTRLNTSQIMSSLRGEILEGCYVPSGIAFAELLETDGYFYDANDNFDFLGLYDITNDQLCFNYPASQEQQALTVCFATYRREGALDFYEIEENGDMASSPVATTDCG